MHYRNWHWRVADRQRFIAVLSGAAFLTDMEKRAMLGLEAGR